MDNISNNSTQINNSRSKVKTIWAWLMVVVILICNYIGIFYSHRYYPFNIVLWIIVIGGVALVMLYHLWLGNGKWDRLKVALFTLIIGVPITFLVIIIHNKYVDKLLIGHEVHTSGIVKEVYVDKGRSSSTPYAIFTYRVNGKIWKQKIINTQNLLVVGDSVKLVCSRLDPEVFVQLK